MTKMKRLFVVHSPHNALACLSIIKQESNNAEYEDYVILAELTPSDYGKSWPIAQSTLKMLNAHTFTRVIDLSGYENKLKGLFKIGDINQIREIVFKELKEDNFDELYIVRNKGKFNTILPYLSDSAKIVAYGEAYNKLDSAIGTGYKKINEFRALLPIDMTNGLLDYVPLRVIPKAYMIAAISDVLNYINDEDKGHIEKLSDLLNEEEFAILILHYLSDINTMGINDEIEMYLDAVRCTCSSNTAILIKEHPRALSISKSSRVKKALVQAGYSNVVVLSKALNTYPIEVICHYLKPNAVISIISTSSLILRYLYNISNKVELDDFLTKYCGSNYFSSHDRMIRMALSKLDNWDPEEHRPIISWNELLLSRSAASPGNEKKLHHSVQGWIKASNQGIFEMVIKDIPNNEFASIFKNAGFSKIIIYGMCSVGKMIVDKLIDSSEDFKLYLVNPESVEYEYRGNNVYTLSSEYLLNKKVDAVICTQTHNYEIYSHQVLMSNLRQHIICSFAEMLDSYFIENEVNISKIIYKLLISEAEETEQKYNKLENKYIKTNTERKMLVTEVKDVKKRNTTLTSEYKNIVREKNTLERDIKLLVKEQDETKCKMDELVLEKNSLKRQISMYNQSTSWKITAPLRWIIRLFQK